MSAWQVVADNALRPLRVVLLISACAITAGCAATAPSLTPISDSTGRVAFDGFSILPPRGEGWVRIEPPPQADPSLTWTAKAYFIKRLTEGVTPPSELHRLTAVVRTTNLGNVKSESRINILKGIAGGISGQSLVDKCFGWDCARYQSTVDQNSRRFPGYVFVLSKQGFIVLHPDSPTFAINVEYRQYYARGVQPLSAEALETEVEPFQKSLELTPLPSTRPIAQTPSADRWESLINPGAKAYEQGRYSEAEASFRAALDEAEKSFGPQDRRVAQTLYSVAIAHHRQGRHAEAEALYRRALAIYEAQPSANDPLYGQTLNDLGTLYSDKHQYEQAETLLQRSLAVREKALGLEHGDVGQSLYNLMVLYLRWGRYAEAEPFAQRALPIYEQVKGEEHQDVGWIVHNLGYVYEQQGRLAEAEPLLKRGVAIMEKALGPGHPDLADHLHDYAAVLRKLGRQYEAEELEVRVKAIREKASGGP